MDFKQSYFETLDLINEAMVQRNTLLEELKRLVKDYSCQTIHRGSNYTELSNDFEKSIASAEAVIQQIEGKEDEIYSNDSTP